MDQVLADTLTANLRSAKTAEAKTDALTLAMIALVDCQRKTSGRVKELVAAVEAAKNKAVGAAWTAKAAWGVGTSGLVVLAIKVGKIAGVI